LVLAGNQIGDPTYLKFPVEYRGKGLAGALVYSKLVTFVENIMEGGLKPGAVIQYYTSKAAYEKVTKGESITYGEGHEGTFKEYIYEKDANGNPVTDDKGNQKITGIVLADYKGTRELLFSGNYTFFAANLNDMPKKEAAKDNKSSKNTGSTKSKKKNP
jgi:hypothetical protein